MINKMIDVMIIYGIGRCLVPEEEKIASEESNKKSKKHSNDGKRKSRVLLGENKLPSFQGKLIHKEFDSYNNLRRNTNTVDAKYRYNSGCKRKIITKEKPKNRIHSNKSDDTSSRRSSLKNIFSATKNPSNDPIKGDKQLWTSLLMILERTAVDLLLNVLNNAITLHRRSHGCRLICTPSRR